MKRKIEVNVNEKKPIKLCAPKEILEVPSEVLITIFEFLSSSERQNLIFVCKKWLEICSEHFTHDTSLRLTESMDYSRTGALYSSFVPKRNSKNSRKFYVTIDFIPTNYAEKTKFFHFIDLIGTKIKHLQINDHKVWFYDTIFSKTPNAETLYLEGFNYLFGMFKFPKKIHTIKVRSVNILALENIKMCVPVTNFACDALEIYNVAWIDIHATFMDEELRDVLKEMMNDGRVKIKSNFNYRTERNMKCTDILGLEFSQQVMTVKPITKLAKLNDLHFHLNFVDNFDFEQLFGIEPFTHDGVTCLKITGKLDDEVYPNFNEILKCFPCLRKLEIRDITLTESHFTFICQNLKDLKELVLCHLNNEFSVKNIFGQDETEFSLKNLSKLEKLVLRCDMDSNQEQDMTTIEWPSLPYLKELNLNVSSFDFFSKKTIKSIAKMSPNITNFSFQSEPTQNDTFEPILKKLGENLTHLTLTGDGIGESLPNNFLVKIILKRCKNLKILSIHDTNTLAMIQEARLFTKIPSLETIKYHSLTDIHPAKQTTRTNFLTLKPYLKSKIN